MPQKVTLGGYWSDQRVATGIALATCPDGASRCGVRGYVLNGDVSQTFEFDAASYRGVALRPDGSGYKLYGDGTIVSFGGAPRITDESTWPHLDVARGIVLRSDGTSGYVLDYYGGLHPFGKAPKISKSWYDYNHGDFARAIVLRRNGKSGYVADAFGGIHPFGGAPHVKRCHGCYWDNWDVVRGMVLRRNGASGYIADLFGGVHSFGGAPHVQRCHGCYWPGWDVIRGMVLSPNGHSGYVVELFGGLHPFGHAPPIKPSWYDATHGDQARAIAFGADGKTGVVLDVYGGVHPFPRE